MEELVSDGESEESLSPIFGFSFDEEGNRQSGWSVDPKGKIAEETSTGLGLKDSQVSPQRGISKLKDLSGEKERNTGNAKEGSCSTSSLGTGLDKPAGFVGFTTALGKPIQVSEKALEEAKKKFEAEDDDDVAENSDSCPDVPLEKLQKGLTKATEKSLKLLNGASKNCSSDIVKDVSALESNMSSPGSKEIMLNVTCTTTTVFDYDQSELEDITRSLLQDTWNADDESSITENDENITSEFLSLERLHSKGAIVSTIKLAVVRVYPVIYSWKTGDSYQYLSEKAYLLRQKIFADKKEAFREKAIPEIEQGIRQSFLPRKSKLGKTERFNEMRVDDMLAYLNSIDQDSAAEILNQLSLGKRKEVEEARLQFEEKIARMVQDEFTKRLEALKLDIAAKPVIKIRVTDLESYVNKSPTFSHGVVYLWNPTEDMLNLVQEHKAFEFLSLKPCVGHELRFNTTKESRILPLELSEVNECFVRKSTCIKNVLSENFSPLFGEFDTVGNITDIKETEDSVIVDLSDEVGNILNLKIWTCLEDSGLKDMLRKDTPVVCTDLQWRANSKLKLAHIQDVSCMLPGNAIGTTSKLDHLKDDYSNLVGTTKMNTLQASEVGSKSLGNYRRKIRKGPGPSNIVESPNEQRTTHASAKRQYLHEQADDPPDRPLQSPAKRGRHSKKFVAPRRVDRKLDN